jgi:Flp pilus assembly protein TadD
MKAALSVALALGCLVATGPRLYTQTPGNNSGPGKGQTAPGPANQPAPQQTPARTQQQTDQNPFPEDTSDIPVIPANNSPAAVPGEGADSPRIPMPASSADPVRSPEDAGAAAESQEKDSSSSQAGLRDLFPPAADDTQPGKHNRKSAQDVPEHQETAAEDENVGNYYLDSKDWKGALSRFESALVLDPDNPDVYWGLAECERHLNQFADARANYQKVMEYDPGSHHAKDARKALDDPEIANAKAAQAAQSSTPSQ